MPGLSVIKGTSPSFDDEFSWSRYWATHLFDEADLALWIKSRSGNSLIDDYGNNATILTKVLNFTAGNTLAPNVSTDFGITTESFGIEFLVNVTTFAAKIATIGGGNSTAAPGWTITQTNIQLSSTNKVVFNAAHNLALAGAGFIYLL
jgi:hypothetical protein